MNNSKRLQLMQLRNNYYNNNNYNNSNSNNSKNIYIKNLYFNFKFNFLKIKIIY